MLAALSALLRPSRANICRTPNVIGACAEHSVLSILSRAIHCAQPEKQVLLSSLGAWRQPCVAVSSNSRAVASPLLKSPGRLPSVWGQLNLGRDFAVYSKLRPKHIGGKLKVYSAFKERFKLTATGKIRHMRTGHRHKRWPKSSDQNRKLRKGRNVFKTYAITMKKLGFKMRKF